MSSRRDFLKTSSALAIGAGSANAVAGSDINMAESVEDKVKIEFYKQKGLEQAEPDMLSYFRRNPYVSSCYASYISQFKEKRPHYFELNDQWAIAYDENRAYYLNFPGYSEIDLP